MSSPKQNNNFIKPDPTLNDLLNLLAKDIMLSINCHAVATVQSFNATNQTVTATMNYKKSFYKKQPNGNYKTELKNYPILIDVPAIVLGGGGFSQRFPIKSGDECLLLFNDRDLDTWFSSGQIAGVPTPRLHSFSDAIALVGLRSEVNSLPDYDPDKYQVTNGKILFSLSETKAEISNATKSLKTILEDLINAINGLKVTGITSGPGLSASLDPGTISALAAVTSDLGDLLE